MSDPSSRYVLYDELAGGGMATVHIGVQRGDHEFRRIVAIKRMHPHLAKQPQFVDMFRDEARITARVRHPNIASMLDVVAQGHDLLLVMEYVHGESLARLASVLSQRGKAFPIEIVASIAIGMLLGLHAAHEARSVTGVELNIVHRDVSPQNVLVGSDGLARVVDFGIARAIGRLQTTGEGRVRGKAAYMAPEQVRGRPLDRRTDIYAASVVVWELLTGRRLFEADGPTETMLAVLEGEPEAPSVHAPEAETLDAIVLRGMAHAPEARFGTALAMAEAIEEKVRPASAHRVATWLDEIAGEGLRTRRARIDAIEAGESVQAQGAEGTAAVREATAATDTVVDVRRPRRKAAFVLGALVSVVATLAAWVYGIRPKVEPPRAAEAPVPFAAPAASPVELPEPPATASAAGPPSAPVRASTPRPKGQVRQGPASRLPNCNPPYTIDRDGFRAPKRECL
jgi:hypothetical protein